MDVPRLIGNFEIVEYGFFAEPILPKGYIPPSDGRLPLEPIQNVAICRSTGIDGYYMMFCTKDWQYVTYEFNETLDYTKLCPRREFGRDVIEWREVD